MSTSDIKITANDYNMMAIWDIHVPQCCRKGITGLYTCRNIANISWSTAKRPSTRHSTNHVRWYDFGTWNENCCYDICGHSFFLVSLCDVAVFRSIRTLCFVVLSTVENLHCSRHEKELIFCASTLAHKVFDFCGL